MNDVPLATHRFYIEPLSGVPHFSRIIVRRYMSFIENIQKSKKVALKQLLELVKRDVRCTTGSNLRFIMLLTGNNTIEDLKACKVDFDYHTVEKCDEWKIKLVKELIDVQQDDLTVEGLEQAELDEILDYLCTLLKQFPQQNLSSIKYK